LRILGSLVWEKYGRNKTLKGRADRGVGDVLALCKEHTACEEIGSRGCRLLDRSQSIRVIVGEEESSNGVSRV
jgi:hypothetical protein